LSRALLALDRKMSRIRLNVPAMDPEHKAQRGRGDTGGPAQARR
jgi:hypothetical protein